MRIDNDTKLDFSDVLIRPKRSTMITRKDVELIRTFTFRYNKNTWSGIPIIAANMDGVGTIAMAKALTPLKVLTALHKYYSEKEAASVNSEYVFFTFGITAYDEKRLKKFIQKKRPRFLCVDVANGYTQRFTDFVKKVREWAPSSVIMAGNVVTGEMTEQLILSGADIVKVGIGSGSVCITRSVTGVGYPQLSAVIECADAAHGLGGLVCSDGGCVTSGDIAKAFGAGSDFVMLGSMLAGHKESELPVIETEDGQCIEYYGSSSDRAMEIHAGGKASYRASEGKRVLLPYRGEVRNTIEEILGGLRSTCTYVGARRLKELSKRTTFLLVNRQLNTSLNNAAHPEG